MQVLVLLVLVEGGWQMIMVPVESSGGPLLVIVSLYFAYYCNRVLYDHGVVIDIVAFCFNHHNYHSFHKRIRTAVLSVDRRQLKI